MKAKASSHKPARVLPVTRDWSNDEDADDAFYDEAYLLLEEARAKARAQVEVLKAQREHTHKVGEAIKAEAKRKLAEAQELAELERLKAKYEG